MGGLKHRAVAAIGLASMAAAGLSACAPASAEPATIHLDVHYSSFAPTRLEVDAGSTVRFVITNRDPIDHELIIGDQGVQDRHENGTEKKHGEIPGEISAPAGETVETTYTFGRPGRLLFGCHLPGHYAYGMRGDIRIA